METSWTHYHSELPFSKPDPKGVARLAASVAQASTAPAALVLNKAPIHTVQISAGDIYWQINPWDVPMIEFHRWQGASTTDPLYDGTFDMHQYRKASPASYARVLGIVIPALVARNRDRDQCGAMGEPAASNA